MSLDYVAAHIPLYSSPESHRWLLVKAWCRWKRLRMGAAEVAASLVTEPGLVPDLLNSRWGFSTAQAVPKARHSKCRLWAWWGEVAQEPSTGPGQGLHPSPPAPRHGDGPEML